MRPRPGFTSLTYGAKRGDPYAFADDAFVRQGERKDEAREDSLGPLR